MYKAWVSAVERGNDRDDHGICGMARKHSVAATNGDVDV
jgi:hypothetical protein